MFPINGIRGSSSLLSTLQILTSNIYALDFDNNLIKITIVVFKFHVLKYKIKNYSHETH